jgi:2-keto-3-deoxy-L-rhamnonate aldolase RhmA
MPTARHWIKAELARDMAVAGLMMSELKTPMLGALLDAVGLHFAIIDQEHGAYGADTLAAVVAGFRGGRCLPLVRIPEIRREYVLTPLELGVAGILAPRVESRTQAEDLVRFCRYPPAGDRGISLCRAHTGFRRVDRNDYTARANADILLMAQIETQTALDNLDDILATPGIDMAFIGPSDLALSCGIDASPRTPRMRAIIERVVATARAQGLSVGIHTYDLEAAAELVAAGVGFISFDTDVNALQKALGSGFETLHDLTGGRLADPAVA